jgi:hypothetical protein
MRYLLSCTDTYRVDTVAEVEALHEELSTDVNFTLAAFSYKTKPIKEKGEIVGEYQVVTAKKVFNAEKEPDNYITIHYEV